jgi:hypothetical protein
MSDVTPGARVSTAGSCPLWIKSSLSFANGDCVEVARLADGRIGVRDSKDADGPVLQFTPSEWNAFTGGVRNGEFDSLLSSLQSHRWQPSPPGFSEAAFLALATGIARDVGTEQQQRCFGTAPWTRRAERPRDADRA